MEGIVFVVAVIVIFIATYIYLYNLIIGKKNAVSNAYASIDVYLKQRFDLIPNLVASVKEYMKHERGLLEKITELRASIGKGGLNQTDRLRIEGEMSSLIGKLFVVAENYPQLRANENFLHLQQTLMEIEDRISAARRAYNAAVTDYNNTIEMFPTNMVANFLGLKKIEWLQIQEPERKTPDLKSLFKE